MLNEGVAEAKDTKYIENKIKKAAKWKTHTYIYPSRLKDPKSAWGRLIDLGYKITDNAYDWSISWA